MIEKLKKRKLCIEEARQHFEDKRKETWSFLERLLSAYHDVFCFYNVSFGEYYACCNEMDIDEPDYEEDVPQYYEEIIDYNIEDEGLSITVNVHDRDGAYDSDIVIPEIYVSEEGIEKLKQIVQDRANEVEAHEIEKAKAKRESAAERRLKQYEKLKKECQEN